MKKMFVLLMAMAMLITCVPVASAAGSPVVEDVATIPSVLTLEDEGGIVTHSAEQIFSMDKGLNGVWSKAFTIPQGMGLAVAVHPFAACHLWVYKTNALGGYTCVINEEVPVGQTTTYTVPNTNGKKYLVKLDVGDNVVYTRVGLVVAQY